MNAQLVALPSLALSARLTTGNEAPAAERQQAAANAQIGMNACLARRIQSDLEAVL